MDFLTRRQYLNYTSIFWSFQFSTWFSETKRKRHDMNPVSKSVASSGLLNAIERKKGILLKYSGFGST